MKKIKILILTLFMFIGISNVSAFSINSSTSVTVGNSVAVTVEAYGLTGRFDISSSDSSVLAGNDSKWIENAKQVFYFTAKKVGKATITVRANNVTDSGYNDFSGSRSITVNVVNKTSNKPINVNKNYSKNNNLKSLGIEGYKLDPAFNKDILEYKVELTPGTEKIKINATKEDNTSNIKGIGEFEVNDGVNTFNIVVIAENGNEKTYKITANMEEKDPILVTLDGKEYTVVKKDKELEEAIDGYEKTTVKIKEFDIPAFHNNATKVNLVGLKDKEGKIIMVAYDSKNNTYSIYKEISFDKIGLYIEEDKESKYEKVTIKIHDEEVNAYKLEGLNDFVLLYGVNTTTGNEGYYLYDKIENTVQRYDTELVDNLTEENKKYFNIIVALAAVSILSILFLIIKLNKKKTK